MSQPPDFFPPVSSCAWGGRVTRAEINLDAIGHNIRTLRQMAPSSRLMAVVKGDGYGHGAIPVARAALANGASWLGVYTVEEGVALRRAIPDAPILVLGPFQSSEVHAVQKHSLTATLASVETAEALSQVAAGSPIRFHVKLDTGLHRAGIEPEHAIPFLDAVSRFPGLEFEGLFTHFACADEQDTSSAHRQLQIFADVAAALAGAGFVPRIRHAANSAAILNLPESHFDMVRAGISMYGYYPSSAPHRDIGLRPALSLLSAVTRVHHVPCGEGVGYGYTFKAPEKCVLALIPVGYGDGLPRCLGEGRGRALVRGKIVPIVGRVSMDQITVDVSAIPEIQVGDPAVLIGRQGDVSRSADEVARESGTISYEVLTALLPRVPRLYVMANQVVETTCDDIILDD